MSEQHSVTAWFDGLYQGDEDAVNRLFERYHDKLVELGRKTYRMEFGNILRPTDDEEDAALSALHSFYAGVKKGRFRDLRNRDDLWSLLKLITIRKIYDQRARITAKKRGGRDASVAGATNSLEDVVSRLPGPALECELRDTYRVAMEKLADPELKRIAEMNLAGSSRQEIATALGLTERTIYRKLILIHEKWDAAFEKT